jgi:hypothetical protein
MEVTVKFALSSYALQFPSSVLSMNIHCALHALAP